MADVHECEYHIACDSASQSELVIPIISSNGELVAVLDMDCPVKNGFSIEDEKGMLAIAQLVAHSCDWINMSLPSPFTPLPDDAPVACARNAH